MNRSSHSPRILYVSEILPSKAAFGAEMRCLHIARALREMGAVEVALLGEHNEQGNITAPTGCEFPLAYTFDIRLQPKRTLVEKFKWTLNTKADYPHGYGVERDAMRGLLENLDKYDLIWFFKLRTPEMFPHAVWQRSVVDIDDLPTTYERAILRAGGGPRERLSARRRLFSWQRRERLLGDRFTVLTVCSEEDKQYLKQIGVRAPVHVIPNGFEKPEEEPIRSPAVPPRIGFIGLFDFFPNRDGVDWFVRQCWPLIKRRVPDARLRLVGQDTDGFTEQFAPDIDRLGWVANTSEEMKTWSAMVVPIRVGAGTRIKIAHGFSQKCPIISTTFGAYGYGSENGREMYLADSAEAFAQACIQVIREPETAAQMAERAWRQFLEKWTWDSIRSLVWTAAEDCLRRQSTRVNAG